jgi:hypothetical protein
VGAGFGELLALSVRAEFTISSAAAASTATAPNNNQFFFMKKSLLKFCGGGHGEPPPPLHYAAFGLAFSFVCLCFMLQQDSFFVPSFAVSSFAFISHESPVQQEHSFASPLAVPSFFIGHEPSLQEHVSIEQQACDFSF